MDITPERLAWLEAVEEFFIAKHLQLRATGALLAAEDGLQRGQLAGADHTRYEQAYRAAEVRLMAAASRLQQTPQVLAVGAKDRPPSTLCSELFEALSLVVEGTCDNKEAYASIKRKHEEAAAFYRRHSPPAAPAAPGAVVPAAGAL